MYKGLTLQEFTGFSEINPPSFWDQQNDFCGNLGKFKQVSNICAKLLQSRPYPARLLHPRAPPGKNTGVGCHFLLQGIFPGMEL